MHELLEKYLSQVESRLRPMPAEARNAEVEELKQHLLQLIEVNKRHGCDEQAATMMAIRQFGSARKLAQGLNNAVPYGKADYVLAALNAIVSVQAFILVLGLILFTYGAVLLEYMPERVLGPMSVELMGTVRLVSIMQGIVLQHITSGLFGNFDVINNMELYAPSTPPIPPILYLPFLTWVCAIAPLCAGYGFQLPTRNL